jgi:UDP-N-acetylenolpyruvoylglucosamine reductase
VRLLGRGSNLLVPDEGVRGLVVRLAGDTWCGIRREGDGALRAGSGARLKRICAWAAEQGLAGFEFLEGIPGTVGGALVMNAGAMGGWMHDLVASIRVLTQDASIRTLTPEEAPAGYRSCPALRDAIVLDAVLRARGCAPRPEIEETVRRHAQRRKETQPREPSAGCAFRNPPGGHAGRIIDELGLKGRRIGGAEVSPVHANFIINRGGATAGDVIALMREVRETVRERRGVTLEPEVLLFGRDWKEVLP